MAYQFGVLRRLVCQMRVNALRLEAQMAKREKTVAGVPYGVAVGFMVDGWRVLMDAAEAEVRRLREVGRKLGVVPMERAAVDPVTTRVTISDADVERIEEGKRAVQAFVKRPMAEQRRRVRREFRVSGRAAGRLVDQMRELGEKSGRGKFKRTAAQRKAVSRRMKAYWAKRHKG
jgi:hypothetical protein